MDFGFRRRVQFDSGVDEGFERLFIDLVAFLKVDGTASVAVEAGIEEARRVFQ